MGWASGFESGSRVMGDILDTYDKSKQRNELEQIAKATPESYQGFTPEQGEALRKAAESGADVQFDDATKAYVVTPRAMGADEAGPVAPVQRIAQQGVTDFLGSRTAAMNDTQIANARQRAMAGVVMKSDPVTGQRMMRDVTQGERDDKRFGWEEDRMRRETAKEADAQKYIDGLKDLHKSSEFSKNQAADAQAAEKYRTDLAAHQARVQAGDHTGVAPTAPSPSTYTVGQSLADGLTLAQYNMANGKGDPDKLISLAKARQAMEQEGYTKALKLAQGGATIDQIAAEFNRSGSDRFDPKAVVSDKIVDKGQGIKTRVITFKDAQGKVQSIDAMAELDALGAADKLIANMFEGKRIDLAQNADRRDAQRTSASVAHTVAQTGILNQTLEEKKELNTIRTGLNDAIAKGDEAAIQTGRAQMMNYMMSGKSGMKDMSPEERRANFYLASGAAKNAQEAARMSHERVQTSPKDDYMALMKPNSMGMVPKPEDVEPVMAAMHGANWMQKLGGAAPGSMWADPKAIAIRDDKSLSMEEKRSKLKALGYQ